jgi:hypothetical protein
VTIKSVIFWDVTPCSPEVLSTFRSNVFPSSLLSKSMPRKQQAVSRIVSSLNKWDGHDFEVHRITFTRFTAKLSLGVKKLFFSKHTSRYFYKRHCFYWVRKHRNCSQTSQYFIFHTLRIFILTVTRLPRTSVLRSVPLPNSHFQRKGNLIIIRLN